MSEEIITQENFHEYFRDMRTSRPEKGDVIARFTAMADFIDGRMKKDIVDLLYNKNKVEAAIQVMRKLGSATEKDSIRVCREVCQDLASGMSIEEIEQKPYRYQIEFFYYTKKENIPIDDDHWSVITLDHLDEFSDSSGQRLKMKTTFLPDAQEGAEETDAV